MPLRPSSANLCTSFDSSFRRSSVSAGSGMRTTLPSLAGFSPRLALRIAFSIAPSSEGSKGCATISVGSGIERDATWFTGIADPYASTWTVSRMLTDARPVRTPPSSRRTCSIWASMRFLTSANRPFRSLTSILSSLRRDGGADGLAGNHPAQVARGAQIEHHDRQLVVHAQRDGGGIHHPEALLQHFQVRDPLELRGVRLEHRVGGVDPVDLRALEDHV